MKIKIELEEADFFNWEPQEAELYDKYTSASFCATGLYEHSQKNSYGSSHIEVVSHAPAHIYLEAQFWETLASHVDLTNVASRNNLLKTLTSSNFSEKIKAENLNILENPYFNNFFKNWGQASPYEAIKLVCGISHDFLYSYQNLFLKGLNEVCHRLSSASFSTKKELSFLIDKAFNAQELYEKGVQEINLNKERLGSAYLAPAVSGQPIQVPSYETIVNVLSILPHNRLLNLLKLDASEFKAPNSLSKEQFLQDFQEDILALKNQGERSEAENIAFTLGVNLKQLCLLALDYLPQPQREKPLNVLTNSISWSYGARDKEKEIDLVLQYQILEEGSVEKYLQSICSQYDSGDMLLPVAQQYLGAVLQKYKNPCVISEEVLKKSIEIWLQTNAANNKNLIFFSEKSAIKAQCEKIFSSPTLQNKIWLEKQLEKNPKLFYNISAEVLEKLEVSPQALSQIFQETTKSYDTSLEVLPKKWLSIENILKYANDMSLERNYEEINRRSGVLRVEEVILSLLNDKEKKNKYQNACQYAINKYAMLSKNKEVLKRYVENFGADHIYALEIMPGNKLTQEPIFMAELIKVEPNDYLLTWVKGSELWDNPWFARVALEKIESTHSPEQLPQAYQRFVPAEVLSFIGEQKTNAQKLSQLYSETMRSSLGIETEENIKKPKKPKF